MKVLVKKVNWHLSKDIKEGTVSFQIGKNSYKADSIFDDYPLDQSVDVEFSHFSDIDDPWQKAFDNNPEKKKCLVNTKDCSYDGFAQIISIHPIKADFGDIILDLGNWSNDERIVGEYIFWPIARLSISRK